MDEDGVTELTMKLVFGPETIQDEKMDLLGIVVNAERKLAICTTCHSAVAPDKLYEHVRLFNHIADRGDFKPGNGRLAFATHEFFTGLIGRHSLVAPEPPGVIIPAIPGLGLRRGMIICVGCGYAVERPKSIQRHYLKSCPQAAPPSKDKQRKGPAQIFSPTSNRGYFGVRLSQRFSRSKLDPAALFRKEFASDPYTEILVKAAAHPREMNVFLKTDADWLLEVDGLTGSQITNLARHSLPDLWAKVRATVTRYVSRMIAKLRVLESPMRLSMGDYNG